jgi:hypothetical protein
MRKTRTDAVEELSIFDLKKWHHLDSDSVFDIRWSIGFEEVSARVVTKVSTPNPFIELIYGEGEGEEFKRYFVKLVKTYPFYGGSRYWFVCPLAVNGVWCRRRVGKLYLLDGYFGCRHCHSLTYASQQISRTGYRSFFFYHMARYKRLIDRYERLRTKFFKGNLTKRHTKYAKKQQELDQLLGLGSQDNE